MDNFYKRFFDYLSEKNMNPEIIHNKIWLSNNHVLQPVGPAFYDYTLNKSEIKNILKTNKYILVTFTDGFDGIKNKKWYAVISRKFIHYDELENSKLRYEIKRGLKNIHVELIDPGYILRYGFEPVVKASSRYSKKIRLDENEFKKNISVSSNYNDIVNYWGVFHRKNLIGFAEVIIYGNIEANYSSIKIDPDYLKYYPFYALLYIMNEHYLNKINLEYTNDGYRSILHPTAIQDFLIRKFNFQKEYTNNTTFFHPLVKMGIIAGIPVSRIAGRIFPGVKALYTLYDASK